MLSTRFVFRCSCAGAVAVALALTALPADAQTSRRAQAAEYIAASRAAATDARAAADEARAAANAARGIAPLSQAPMDAPAIAAPSVATPSISASAVAPRVNAPTAMQVAGTAVESAASVPEAEVVANPAATAEGFRKVPATPVMQKSAGGS
ncbi:MAG: hypothetical protein ACI8TX_002546 [Hyphomicrobiaceae bacterium]|jgi:hypothetical protein